MTYNEAFSIISRNFEELRKYRIDHGMDDHCEEEIEAQIVVFNALYEPGKGWRDEK